jgi:hypothetical protein
MTVFRRSGFWRCSVNGNIHWVDEHLVERDHWDRDTGSYRNENLLKQVRAHVGTTARLVNPNAECPVCSAPVFFYQNVHGSRVFFDELGPPWPKHPCIHNELAEVDGAYAPIALTYADLRSQDEYDFIQKWNGAAGEEEFYEKYGTLPWEIFVCEKCYLGSELSVVVLRNAVGHKYFLAPKSGDLSMLEGQLVSYYKGWLSYLSPSDLRTVEFKLRRVGAKKVLHHFLGVEELDLKAYGWGTESVDD